MRLKGRGTTYRSQRGMRKPVAVKAAAGTISAPALRAMKTTPPLGSWEGPSGPSGLRTRFFPCFICRISASRRRAATIESASIEIVKGLALNRRPHTLRTAPRESSGTIIMYWLGSSWATRYPVSIIVIPCHAATIRGRPAAWTRRRCSCPSTW